MFNSNFEIQIVFRFCFSNSKSRLSIVEIYLKSENNKLIRNTITNLKKNMVINFVIRSGSIGGVP